MTVLELAQSLVRTPSRAGVDDYGPVVTVLTEWFRSAGLKSRVLVNGTTPVAVVVDVDGATPGGHLVLDACLDTAGVGDPAAWSRNPFSGDVDDGWLHGRGSADSKAAVAVFAHLALDFAATRSHAGRLTVLADLDEHTGGFAGIRRYLEEGARPDGVMVGYPGEDRLVTGGRGVWRARITVHGRSGHSGSSTPATGNAITRAARLVDLLASMAPREVDPLMGMPGKVTPTSIQAGAPGGFSIVPDVAVVEVDLRLVTTFTVDDAVKLVETAAATLDAADPGLSSTRIEPVGEPWPPFRLPDDHKLVATLLAGARSEGWDPRPGPAGPSNIGCLLAQVGIPATVGWGPRYRGLHGTDEAVEVASLPRVLAAYGHAARSVLAC